MNSVIFSLEKATNKILFGVLVTILVVANVLIVNKEHVLANGTTMLLELAPRDPRSILQGDYMVLRYRMAGDVARHTKQLTDEGQLVVSLDANNVARFRRIHDSNTALGTNEHLLFYRKRNGVVKIATDAYFFQEQHGNYYSAARYGELRVTGSGDAVLTSLRDKDFNNLSATTIKGT